jgi:NAD(P)-dependent dehydrogenase (short-subunit alcohol dehydrogenase family)
MDRFSLDGKVALVTGAARGLGALTARTVAAAGAKVLLTDVLAAEAESVAAAICADGGQALALAHDVVDEAQWVRAVDTAVQRLGGLDIVVNNAGIETMALFADCTVEDWDRTHDINVKGVFLGIKHAIRAMRPGGSAGLGGVIVNLSSVAGLVGLTALGAYCSSKGAVRLMTKAAAAECAKLGYGIRVNSIHPAIVKTEMGANVVKGFARTGLAPDEATADAYVESLHPLGYGEPEDVASAVLYLASPASRWMTGSEFVVDGGATVS